MPEVTFREPFRSFLIPFNPPPQKKNTRAPISARIQLTWNINGWLVSFMNYWWPIRIEHGGDMVADGSALVI